MRRPRMYRLSAVVTAGALALSASCGSIGHQAEPTPTTAAGDGVGTPPTDGTVQLAEPVTSGPYPVTKVVDGDTLWVQRDGLKVKLRLIVIDTPETHDPRRPVQCFGEAAASQAEVMLAGHQVLLETDDSQGLLDRYGRELVYVWVDGRLFNLEMIQAGFAHEYTYDKPYRYQQQFKNAESAAVAAGVGLWAGDTCGGDTTQAAGG